MLLRSILENAKACNNHIQHCSLQSKLIGCYMPEWSMHRVKLICCNQYSKYKL